MGDGVLNVVLGVVATGVSATLGWLARWFVSRRRRERTRAFFGLFPGTECLLVVNRHMKGEANSVNRRDVYALMELAALVKECGAAADLVAHDEVRQGLGAKSEFCLGGPPSNVRTAAHMAWRLPGVRFEVSEQDRDDTALHIGGRTYRGVKGEAEYVLVARLAGAEQQRPAFLVCGQRAITNQAGARYLVGHQRELFRRYGLHGAFCLLLKVVRSDAYGPDVVEFVGDVTAEATAPPPTASPEGATPGSTGPDSAESSAGSRA